MPLSEQSQHKNNNFSLSGYYIILAVHIPGLKMSETMERLDGAFSIWLTTAARNSSNRDPSLKLTFRCCTARDEGLEKGESNSMTIKILTVFTDYH